MGNPFEKSRALVGEDFHSFLIAKGVSLECPACGSDNLAIMADGADGPVHVLSVPVAEPERLRGNEAAMLVLSCRNCGNVRYFHAIDVVDWKESRDDAPQG